MNITHTKQRKLVTLGEAYIAQHDCDWQSIRFDAIEVEFPTYKLKRPKITHIPDAFRA